FLTICLQAHSTYSTCTESNIPSSKPSYMTHDTFDISSGALSLRCTDGRVLTLDSGTTGYSSDGYLDLLCVNDTWEAPAEWPTEDKCQLGAECQRTDLTSDLPAHLSISSPPDTETVVASGSMATYGCSDNTKVLAASQAPFERECYNGAFFNSSKGADLPVVEDCVDPSPCPLSQLNGLMIPGHMETTADYSSTINHDEVVDFQCRDGKQLDPVVDPQALNKISLKCNSGTIESPLSWPTVMDCKAFCDPLTLPDTGYDLPEAPYSAWEGQNLTITCSNSTHFVDTDWATNKVVITCQSNGSFDAPSIWPTCAARPKCGTPPVPSTATNLELADPTVTEVEVTNAAIYKCKTKGQVTSEGTTVNVPCIKDGSEVTQTYKLPVAWNGAGTQCRAPTYCGIVPFPPTTSGLQAETPPTGGYPEFSNVTYACKDPEHILYSSSKPSTMATFEIECLNGGQFPTGIAWPYCDVANPPKCKTPLKVTMGVEIELHGTFPTNGVSVGGSITYRCKDPAMTTALGYDIKVTCERDFSEGTADFRKPNSWDTLKCRPAAYPNFERKPCICPGDPGVSPENTREILNKVCRKNSMRRSWDGKTIPLKTRCGVQSLSDISTDSFCQCEEKNDLGVDFAVWSLGEVTSYKWQANYSDPSTTEFFELQMEIQKELDNLILDKFADLETWPFVRSYMFGVVPGKPLGCSENVIPEPAAESGLVVVEKKYVPFGQSIDFRCKNPNYVTNDGVLYKLRCMDNGRFLNRLWLECRPRKICLKPPPRPDDRSGLKFSESINVPEFNNAVYECKQPGYVVPNTKDGKFRTPCKRTSSFEQSVRIDWPVCTMKPTEVCEPVPSAPAGYVLYNEVSQFITVGQKLTFGCQDSKMLMGDTLTMSFTCVKESNNTFLFKGLDVSNLPQCRFPSYCDPTSLPLPPESSGLDLPIQSQKVEEGGFVEYSCSKGLGWSLVANDVNSKFIGSQGIVVGGKLRLYCGAGPSFGNVTQWPVCRNLSITQCDPIPDFSSFGLKSSITGSVAVGVQVTLSCVSMDEVTEHFATTEMTCGPDGKYHMTKELTDCRPALECPVAPDAPEESRLVKVTATAVQEFQTQEYKCEDGFTLDGVITDSVINSMGRLSIPCMLADGEFVPPATWPTCVPIASQCSQVPTLPGFTTLSVGPMSINERVYYTCSNQGEVTDQGRWIDSRCTHSGIVAVPVSIPACRKAKECESPPVPDQSLTRLMPSQSLGIREFGLATYKCVEGSTLSPEFADTQGNFNLQCGLNGAYPQAPNFPTCAISSCISVEAKDRFTTGDVAPIAIGEHVRYECSDTGQIPGDSPGPVEVECMPDGTLNYPDPFPVCRSKASCSSPYPVPPASSFLLKTLSSLLNEFDWASYACKEGATLQGVSNPFIENGRFKAQCQVGGTWNTTIDWPTCIVEFCPQAIIPSFPGYTRIGTGDAAVQTNVEYKCTDPSKIMPGGTNHLIPCNTDGTVDDTTPPPTCELANVCPSAPIPDASHNLAPYSGPDVQEFNFALYGCKDGSTLEGVTNPNVENNKFKLECEVGGQWPVTVAWPTCIVEKCAVFPAVGGIKPKHTTFVPVGGFSKYICELDGQVFDSGMEIDVECLADGTLDIPDPIPSCRAPVSCPAPPIPSAASSLQGSTSSNVTEFSSAEYMCQEHTFLAKTDPSVKDGKFMLQCQAGGVYDANPTWTSCRHYRCDPSALTIPAGFKVANPEPFVYTNEVYTLVCETEGEVTSEGPFLSLTCQEDGTFTPLPTNPTCAASATCPAPTVAPPAENRFKPYDSEVEVKVYGHASFECQEGYFIKLGNSEYLSTYELKCEGDQTYETPVWPKCGVKTCNVVPPTGFQVSNDAPFRDESAFFSCTSTNQVTDVGKTIPFTCLEDGTYDTPNENVTCRSPQTCSSLIPDPPADSNLVSMGSQVSKEYDIAMFKCELGFTFKGTTSENRPDTTATDFFHLPCEGTAGFPDPVDWPTCVPRCESALIPPTAEQSLRPRTFVYIDPGQHLEYECEDQDYGVPTSHYFKVECGLDGQFIPPATWPTCELRNECPFAPEPPTGSNMQIASALPSKDHDVIKYECKSGFSFVNNEGLTFPSDVIPGVVRMKCGSDGRFSHIDLEHYNNAWPVCEPGNQRRKRLVDYTGLHDDIDYSILIMVEFQFMYTPELESDMKDLFNSTKDQANYTQLLVELFHSQLGEALGDGEIRAGLSLRVPFTPTCEQPTNAEMPAGSCVQTGNYPVCPHAVINGAWLGSLGYEYKIQNPKWMNHVANLYHLPVGSEINFFCKNKLKRPRKDENDGDPNDGIITAVCRHTGEFSVTMNPGDWDRCRSLCSPEKPMPPTVENAQLIPYDSEQKWQREHWEDEEISYGCENTSLVLNEEVGVKSVVYLCLEGGTYSTPPSSNLWPQCGPKPIDPYIIFAVDLMTAKYDRNLQYRHELTQGNITTTEFLQSTEGILSITVPCISVIILLIFFILCCTRANSPICKIFEPQA
ncbi:hypothetical protein TCAL_04063, partial [Tigriopus californicus]